MKIEKEQIKEIHTIGNFKTKRYLEENFEKAFVQKPLPPEPIVKPNHIFYSVKEMSVFTGFHTKTIEAHCRNGLIEAIKFGGKWIVTDENLKKFINMSKRTKADLL